MPRTILATVLLLTLSVLGACGKDDPPSSRTATKTAEPTQTVGAVDPVDVGGNPVGIAATGSGDVWVALPSDDAVVQVKAQAEQPGADAPVLGVPLRLTLAEGGDALWVTAFGKGEVVRVDTGTRKATDRVRVGAGAEGVAAAFGSIWVAVQDDGLLVRVDPGAREVIRKVDVGQGVRLVVPGPDALWLDDHATGRIVRVDPRTYAVRRSEPVCDGPEDLVASGPTVWVTCSVSEELVALDAIDLEPTKRIPLAGNPDAITAAPDGSLLVVLQDGPTLVRLDSTTGEELGRTRLGQQPQLHDQGNLDIAVAGDDAWITSFSDGRVLRTPWRG